MFEYWFDTEKPFHGTTSDFLEVLCQIAEHFNTDVAGTFVSKLLMEQDESLAFLRVIEWNFEHEWTVVEVGPEPWSKYSIKLYYVPR